MLLSRLRLGALGALAAALLLLLPSLAAPRSVVAATSYPCTENGLDQALAAGGDATFACSGATTITITQPKTAIRDVTLDGGGILTISGADQFRVFGVIEGVTVGLSNLTITRGASDTAAGGINNRGNLILTNVTVSANTAVPTTGGDTNRAGGVANEGAGVLVLVNSTVADNVGGGIVNRGAGLVMLNGSTVTNNKPSGVSLPSVGILNTQGRLVLFNSAVSGHTNGGLRNGVGIARLVNSTVSGNSATEGAGINNISGPLTLLNSTIAGNSATNGAGLANVSGTLTITNSTIANNTAQGAAPTRGGGAILSSGGTVTLTNSTVAGNTAKTAASAPAGGGLAGGAYTLKGTILANADGNCFSGPAGSAFQSSGFNLSSDNSCAFTGTGDQSNVNPLLGPLANNGGPTQTQAPRPGSPALDKIPAAQCPTVDQRHYARPTTGGNVCDIGAVELEGTPPAANPAPPLVSLDPKSAVLVGPAFTLTVTGSNFVDGATILWNGEPRTTTFVNGTTLTAAIPADDLTTAGAAVVTVVNPDGSTLSHPLFFAVVESGTRAPGLKQHLPLVFAGPF